MAVSCASPPVEDGMATGSFCRMLWIRRCNVESALPPSGRMPNLMLHHA